MRTASIRAEWEGSQVNGRFALLEWLGGSEDRGVFLTVLQGIQRAAIKLIVAEDTEADAYIAQWEAAKSLSHPHLMPVLETGRCSIAGTDMVYAVTEYAEETLSEIIAQRALAADEMPGVLDPVLDALSYLHDKGFVHGHVKPSNILFVAGMVKLTGDDLLVAAEDPEKARIPAIYDAPEVVTGTFEPAVDAWSVGITLAEALTQQPVVWDWAARGEPVIPEQLPSPVHEIVQECLRLDPSRRATIEQIRARLDPNVVRLERNADQPGGGDSSQLGRDINLRDINPRDIDRRELDRLSRKAFLPDALSPIPPTAEPSPVVAKPVAPPAGPTTTVTKPAPRAEEPFKPADEPVLFAKKRVSPPDEPIPAAAKPISFASEAAPPAPEPVPPAAEPFLFEEKPVPPAPRPARLSADPPDNPEPADFDRRPTLFADIEEANLTGIPVMPYVIGILIVLAIVAVLLVRSGKIKLPWSILNQNAPAASSPAPQPQPQTPPTETPSAPTTSQSAPQLQAPTAPPAQTPRAPATPKSAPPSQSPSSSPPQPQTAPMTGQSTPPPSRPLRRASAEGAVAQQVLPHVPETAKQSIRGPQVAVIRVWVDSRGSVKNAAYASSGPGNYFARAAMRAAHEWKFSPPVRGGHPQPSVWSIRFYFTRGKTEVSATQSGR